MEKWKLAAFDGVEAMKRMSDDELKRFIQAKKADGPEILRLALQSNYRFEITYEVLLFVLYLLPDEERYKEYYDYIGELLYKLDEMESYDPEAN